MNAGFVALHFADVDSADEQGRHEDEALGGGQKADGLIHEIAEACGQMGERHPHEEETAERVQLRTPFELGKMK